MRSTWDELAAVPELYVGDPGRGRQELESLFARLGADPRGGTAVEVGSGSGRMTPLLAERFERVIALDVSRAMLERTRAAVGEAANVELVLGSGERLDGVGDGVADTLVCYLVLQHLPRRELVLAYLREFARVLAPGGEAFVQAPVLDAGLRPRAWRTLRGIAVPVLWRLRRRPGDDPALRGTRLTRAELDRGLAGAGLRVVATDVGPDAPYRFSRDLFLRLARA
jgi:SAM-dependent methyltransferase